jgi:hypothetical protein
VATVTILQQDYSPFSAKREAAKVTGGGKPSQSQGNHHIAICRRLGQTLALFPYLREGSN